MTSSFLYSVQYHRRHGTLQAFEEIGVQYMHSFADKQPTRPGFEASNSEFRATTEPNELSGPATQDPKPGAYIYPHEAT